AASGLDLIALAVDDGSRDATRLRLHQARQRYPFVRPLHHQRNLGMAAGIRTGIAAAPADATFDAGAVMDADLTHSPEALPHLLEPIASNAADFVLGSRYVPGGGMRGVPFARRAISIVGNAAGRWLLGVPVLDMTSGFRAARTAVFRAITL